MAARLEAEGIRAPLELRAADPQAVAEPATLTNQSII